MGAKAGLRFVSGLGQLANYVVMVDGNPVCQECHEHPYALEEVSWAGQFDRSVGVTLTCQYGHEIKAHGFLWRWPERDGGGIVEIPLDCFGGYVSVSGQDALCPVFGCGRKPAHVMGYSAHGGQPLSVELRCDAPDIEVRHDLHLSWEPGQHWWTAKALAWRPLGKKAHG